MTSPELDGVLPIDKPVGPTSHDAVAIARRALHTRRIGHTGTLDPFASGLLLLCVGRATRIAEYLTAQPKSYRAVLRLGAETDTDDHTGSVLRTSERWRELDAAAVEAALARQQGIRLQTPPAYSAKKVAGERLYERARRGETVEPAAVQVHVHEIRLEAHSPPDVAFEVTCSSGTYIRAIARDVGRELDTFAHLVSLRRTAIGGVRVEGATALEALASQGLERPLLTPLAALAHLPRIDLDDADAAAVRHGRAISVDSPVDEDVVVLAYDGALLAIARLHAGRAQPRKVMVDG